MQDEQAVKLAQMVKEVTGRRVPIETSWLAILRAWKNSSDNAQYHSPTFKYRVPALRRAVERSVTRATQALLPGPQFFEVKPGHEFDVANGQQADAVRAYMTFLLTRKIKARRLVTQLARSLYLYGRSIVKTGIRVERRFGTRTVWPTARAVDPFMFYVWPETASETEDITMIVEQHMMAWESYESEAQALPKAIVPIRRVDLTKPVWVDTLIERLGRSGFADPSDVPAASTVPSRQEGFLAISEVWLRSAGQWVMIWLLWNHRDGPKIIRQHASLFPEPPYRIALARPLSNEHYTNGQGDDLRDLDTWFNDTLNQMEDARVATALPPICIDPDEAPRLEELQFGSRIPWRIKPEFAKVLDIPDTSVASLRVAQFAFGLLNTIGGSGQVAEGQPGRNMPRAGYAVNQLVSLSMADIKDVAEILEQENLTPMLQDLYDLTLDFIPHSQVIRIPGSEAFPDPRAVTTASLLGSWDFNWTGSLQSADVQMRSQKLLSFAQILTQASQQLIASGYKVNWPDLLKMVFRDGLGERGLEQIILPLSEEEKAQMAAATQGGQGGPGVQARGIPQTQDDMVRQMARQFQTLAGAGGA